MLVGRREYVAGDLKYTKRFWDCMLFLVQANESSRRVHEHRLYSRCHRSLFSVPCKVEQAVLLVCLRLYYVK